MGGGTKNFVLFGKFCEKRGASAIFPLGGAFRRDIMKAVRLRFAENRKIFSGGELGSTGRAKRELRVEVDRLAS